jgi:hypothetical protein
VRALFFPLLLFSGSFESSQAIDRIKERNPNAFNKPVAGGTQRRCKCKRSQCLKKYCECFQAGLPCLRECACVSCHNYEGSDMRTRAMAGEELDLKPRRFDADDEEVDDEEDEEGLLGGKARSRRPTRRKVAPPVYDEGSDGAGGEADINEIMYAPPSPSHPSRAEQQPRGGGSGAGAASGAAGVALVAPGFGATSYETAPVSRPGALPVRLPAGSTRSFRNQLVRLDLCSFIGSSIHPFCNMLMLGAESNARPAAAQAVVAVKAEAPEAKMDLRAGETMSRVLLLV